VVVKDLDGFLDGFHLLYCRVWNDTCVGGLDVVEDWITSSTLPTFGIVSTLLLSHSRGVGSSDGGLLVGRHGFGKDQKRLLKEGESSLQLLLEGVFVPTNRAALETLKAIMVLVQKKLELRWNKLVFDELKWVRKPEEGLKLKSGLGKVDGSIQKIGKRRCWTNQCC
jgi:hypothetical protein